MKIIKTVGVDKIPVFRPDLETVTGGFKLILTGLTVGSILAAGSAIVFDELARTAQVLKGAVVTANVGGGVTVIPVAKGHGFTVGQFIGKTPGGQTSNITVIDTSNALFDNITVGTSLGALTQGDALFQAGSTSATGTYSVTPTADTFGLLKNATVVDANGTWVDVVNKCTVYVRRIPGIIPALRAINPEIKYSNSK